MISLAMCALLAAGAVNEGHLKQGAADIAGPLIILLGGVNAERYVGESGEAALRQEYGESSDERLTSRVENVFSRLLNTPDAKRKGLDYSVSVLSRDEVNALALPGGKVFVFEGLAGLPGLKDDELASVLGHELGHSNKGHGMASIKDGLLKNVGLQILRKMSRDEFVNALGSVLGSYLTAKNSRDQELEADRLGFQAVVKAGYDTTAPLAFMRRLQTFEKRNSDPIGELFTTHPRSEDRARVLKTMHFESKYASSYGVIVSSVKVVARIPWNDPAWKALYIDDTGWTIPHDGDPASAKYDGGQCTWFAQTVWPDEVPGGNAWEWYDRCKAAGFKTIPRKDSKDAQPGDLIVWNRKVADSSPNNGKDDGFGHVAIVARRLSADKFEVWDSNWWKPPDQRVWLREVDIRKDASKITGFIHPKSPMPLRNPGPDRQEMLLQGPEFYLGDGEQNASILWEKMFQVSRTNLGAYRLAYVKFELKAVPEKDPIVSINRKEVGRIVAKDDHWAWYETLPFSVDQFREGNNLIDIETYIVDARRSFDDCWIRNVTVVFQK